ncbi:MAG: flagellar biosynthetic protein FliO [Vallitaleaceae bacterium]|nr:flagellar biosynthetic protein FliO [Vallitaleaceae bacterium]
MITQLVLSLQRNSGLQLVFLLFLFLAIILLAYYVSYMVAKFQKKTKKGSNLEIIEAISIGQQKNILLLRVGKKHILLGVTKTQIVHLLELEEDDVNYRHVDFEQNFVPFARILHKLNNKDVGSDSNEESGESHHEQ